MNFLLHMYELAKKRAAGMEPCKGDVPGPSRPFKQALKGMAVIAEVKYAAPAEGDLGIRRRPAELASEYESMGAAAISCLTEPAYFAGAWRISEYGTPALFPCS